MKARFQIQNVTETQPALSAHLVFSQRGGLIGSSKEATWQVQDLDGGIPETAARVMVRDGKFTIEALTGTAIYINEASAPIPIDRPVILSDRDHLKIGALDIVVTTSAEFDDQPTRTHGAVGTLVGAAKESHDALVINGEYKVDHRFEDDKKSFEAADPIAALDTETAQSRTIDPMEAFSVSEARNQEKFEAEIADVVRKPALNQDSGEMADKADMHYASMPNSSVFRDSYGFEEVSHSKTGIASKRVSVDPENPVDHIALRPLARRLGIHIGEMSTEEAARLLGDIGGALRAALSGLNRIYREHGKSKGNFPLATMHLHALEDNPIRFSEDVDSSIHAFFSKRGPVDLSAPSAVEESLEHLYTHQSAVEVAIDGALDAVLTALTPKALERRFEAYENNEIPEKGEAYEAWCWRMYRAYFNELRSERQRGLQMLFWEVFSQDYQVDMRRAERERVLEGSETSE